MAWSEDRMHRWLAGRAGPGMPLGSQGHDAAVLDALEPPGIRPVLCTDQTIVGVHVEMDTPGRKIGIKAVARALSDLAATAAEPVATLLALSAPADADEAWLRDMVEGVMLRGDQLGAPLVGGDLACAPGNARLAVTGLGRFPQGLEPPRRARAAVGELVLLTGPVGGSRLGRHLAIRPRLAEGRWLLQRGATALMDVSDGLAWDLFRLARAAGVGIDLENVPVHDDARAAADASGRDPVWHALHDGEDHELIATAPREKLEGMHLERSARCPGLDVIGTVRLGSGLRVKTKEGWRDWSPEEGGWRHGD